jgi:hypothetical protein
MAGFMKISFDPFRRRNAPAAEPSGKSLPAGFTPEEIAGLLRLRSALMLGQYSETTQEFRRLVFTRWLVEHGRLIG